MFRKQLPKLIEILSRKASTNTRVAYQKPLPDDFLRKTLENTTIKTSEDWKKFREIVITNQPKSQITIRNIDAMTVGVCTTLKNYDLATNYIEFLNKERIPLNLATTGKYLKLLYLKNKNLKETTEKDQNLILNIYKELKSTYPVWDRITTECIILALSVTDRWQECLKLIEEMEMTSPATSICYSTVTAAAFRYGETDLGWKLLNKIIENELFPGETVFTTYFQIATTNPTAHIEKMLKFMQENHLILNEETSQNVKSSLKMLNYHIRDTKIIRNGTCTICRNMLTKFNLSDTEFKELKDSILDKVIIGKNVFYKTTPGELAKFQDFIKNLTPHDVIIDGLNVAYSSGHKSPFVMSSIVAAVVSHFASQNKKVLLLGRDHMQRFPPKNWTFIQQNATVFLTQNISHDDPYLLYCALYCGKNTIIVTKDLMRSHKFLLPTVQQKNLFQKWLSQRQYQLIYVKQTGQPVFKMPNNYSCVPQKSSQYWHIPCESEPNKDLSWMCLDIRK